MDKLSELLSMLKENKLNKTYDRVMTDIADIKSALSVVNEEVNDAILGLLSDGKYEEVNKLTSIPAMSSELVMLLNNLFENSEKVEEKSIEVEKKLIEEEEKSTEVEEKALKYSGIITSVKGLKKGANISHNVFGVGKIISIEDNPLGENKILKVNFDTCGEKPFICTPEILEKHFSISDKDNVNEEENLNHKGKGYNLYTSFNFFIGKKPYKIKIFDRNFYAKSWSEVAVVLFRYIYDENKEAFCKFREVSENKGFSVNPDELRRPSLVRDNIYYEANRSAIDTLTLMSSIADQYANITNKTMRKNIELFIKEVE